MARSTWSEIWNYLKMNVYELRCYRHSHLPYLMLSQIKLITSIYTLNIVITFLLLVYQFLFNMFCQHFALNSSAKNSWQPISVTTDISADKPANHIRIYRIGKLDFLLSAHPYIEYQFKVWYHQSIWLYINVFMKDRPNTICD